MELFTAITTAARRITRELNAGTRGIDYLFTLDGTCVGSIQTGCWFPEGQGPDYQLRIGGGTITQRGVQDRLDAIAAHPDDEYAQGDYLHLLELERESTNRY